VAAEIQITDGIDGEVLLDLNRRSGSGAGIMLGARDQIDLAGVSLPTDGEDRPVVWSQTVGPTPLASRTIQLPLVVFSATPQDLPMAIRDLHEAVRRPWWLRIVRHGSTTPVWLRCYPTAPKVESNPTSTGPSTAVRVMVQARTDPYAYGQRVDSVPALIPQDPTMPGAFVLDLNEVGGDSLTPLTISTDDQQLIGSDTGTLIAVRRRGNPQQLGPLWHQAEAAALTALGANPPVMSTFTDDPEMSGAAAASVQFADVGTAATYGQFAWAAPFSGPEAPGLYRVLVRARRSGAAGDVTVAFRVVVGPTYREATWSASGSDTRVIDCGVIPVPVGMPDYQASPASIRGAVAADTRLLVWRPSAGGGRIDIDWIAFVPADEGCAVLWAEGVTGPVGSWMSVDGYDHTVRVFNGYPFAGSSWAVGQNLNVVTRVSGAMPMLGPGTNRLYVVGGLSPSPNAVWEPSRAVSLQVSYWPRWTWLT